MNTYTDRENLVISVENLPELEEVQYESLSESYKRVRFLESFIYLIIILIGVLVVYYFFPRWGIFQYPYVLGGLGLAISIFVYFSIRIKFANTGYALRKKDILFKTGWLVRKQVSFPISRIQHSAVQSNFIERYFGLSSIAVYTAGSGSDDLLIRGLNKEDAEKINQWVAHQIEANDQQI